MFSAPVIVVVALVAAGAAIIAWVFRGMRCAREKRAVNSGWLNQLDAQRTEHDRLEARNSSLMQQISQYQASIKDARNRSQELSGALGHATEERDELHRELKDARTALQQAQKERDTHRADAQARKMREETVLAALKEKNDLVAHLKGEISNWHGRVQPLVERYRTRNLEAQELANELAEARARIGQLENRQHDAGESRIEPMDQSAAILDASNDQFEESAHNDMSAFDNQPMTPGGFEPGSDRYSHYSGQNLGPRDDLKRIRGVGPAIEKTLNELGIFRFEQIACLTDHEISRIAERLRGFSSRIHRDDWIGQARALHHDSTVRSD